MTRSVWIAKGALAITDQAIFSGSGFLLSLLLARWLTPVQYGAYALSFAVFLFASSFHNALILEPMGVIGAASYGERLPAYIAKLLRMHSVVASALWALAIAGAGAVFLISKNATLAAALCGAGFAIPCVLLSWLLRQSAYLDRRPALAVRGGSVYAVTLLGCVFLERYWGWLNPFSAFLAQAAAGALAGSYLIALLRPDFQPTPTVQMRTVLAEHWQYGRWVIVTAFVYWLSAQGYYFIAAGELGIVDVANIRALQNFFLPFLQFLTSLTLLVMPWASSRFAAGEKEAFQKVIGTMSLLFTAGGILYLIAVSAFGSRLMVLIYGGKYAQSSALLPIVGLSVVFTAAAMGASIGVRAMQRPSEVFAGYASASVFTVLVGFWLTRHWGLRGAIIGMAASAACFLITVTLRYRVRSRTEWGRRRSRDAVAIL
jgi:O-antigen/teichoic acid export membrane protein